MASMYIPKKVIDNSEMTLANFLIEVLKSSKDTNLDIATAFFNIKAYELIKEEIKSVKHFRLLLGKSIELKEEVTLGEILLNKIKEEIEDFDLEKSQSELVRDLINFLKKENVEIRIYTKDFLHGKAYIFDNLVVVGSSNFTRAGLTSNTELNTVSLESEAEYIRKRWFDKFWAQASDFKEDLIKILEDSRFGSKEYSPYEIFIKTLYELQKEDLKFDEDEEKSKEEYIKTRVNLAEFQEDAVRRVFSRLKKYSAVLVADSVGLGKTWIAKKVIEEFGFYKRRNFLIICPAQIRGMWTKEIKDLRLSENILSQEALALDNFKKQAIKVCGGSLKEVSLVVVDESHNFRNPLSNRWENLFNLLEEIRKESQKKPYVLFLTATPINNTLWDLYWQIMLMLYSDQKAFLKQGISGIFEYFKNVEKRQDPALLNDILNEISIRRTRNFIIDNYPDAEINGSLINFPERVLENIDYELEKTYQGMYRGISKIITEELTMAYYRILEYKKVEKLTPSEEMVLGRMIALEGIFKTILLKRLESSVEAFRKSVDKQIKFLEKLGKNLKEGKLLRKEIFNKYVVGLDEESLEEVEIKLEDLNLDDFDKESLFNDILKDEQLLKNIYEKVSPITPEKDAKLIKFKDILYGLAKKGQTVVFTYYADTLEYISQDLKEDARFKQFNMVNISGKVSSVKREKTVDEFFNKNIDILLSTDVLSEGMNLQTAQFVINYDLHWNPTRMIQRAGRIDRIGSPFDKIYVYNFFPEKELEDLLRLVSILQGKIRNIDSSIGLDQTILGETIHPKVFGTIRRIKEKDSSLFDELEREIFGGGEKFYQPLRDFLKKKGIEEIKRIPDGVFSGLETHKIRGIFYYYKYSEDFHFWYLYNLDEGQIMKNKTEIMDFIICKEKEGRVIPDFFQKVYEVNKLIVEDLENNYKQLEQKEQDAPTRAFSKDRRSRFINSLIHDVEFELDNYLMEFPEDKEVQKSWETTLEKLREFHQTPQRLRKIRSIWRNYGQHKNWKKLVKDLHEYIQGLSYFKDDEDVIEPFEINKLKLVCMDFIS
jgi:superfamily II DNA or RNA helicase